MQSLERSSKVTNHFSPNLNESRPVCELPVDFTPFFASDNLYDQLLIEKQKENILDVKCQTVSQTPHQHLPDLGIEDLIAIIHLLTREEGIVIKDKFHKFSSSVDIAEMLINIRSKSPAKVKSVKIVGGMVFQLLKQYIKCNFSTDPKYLMALEHRASDLDVRFYLSNADEEKLNQLKNVVEDSVAFQMRKRGVKEDFYNIKNILHAGGLNDNFTKYNEGNYFSTISLGDLSDLSLDLLFVKELCVDSLWKENSLQLNIGPILDALIKCNMKKDVLIDSLRTGKIVIKIRPECKNEEDDWQAGWDRLTNIVRTDQPHDINEKGAALLMSAHTKGKRTLEDLGPILWDNFERIIRQRVASRLDLQREKDRDAVLQSIHQNELYKLLSKVLRNHHQDDGLAALALTVNTCCSLASTYPKWIPFVWQSMSAHFSFSDHPLIPLLKALMERAQNFKEIQAFLQTLGFLYLCSTGDERISANLIMHNYEPAIQLRLEGNCILLPFDPIPALWELSKIEDPQMWNLMAVGLKPLLSFGLPHETSLGCNWARMEFPWEILDEVSQRLLVKGNLGAQRLGLILFLTSACYNQNHRIFNRVIDYIPQHLTDLALLNMFERTASNSEFIQLLETYRRFKGLADPDTKWKLALAMSSNEEWHLKAYQEWKKRKSIKVGIKLVKALATHRPDLAFKIIFELKKSKIVSKKTLFELIIRAYEACCTEVKFPILHAPMIKKKCVSLFKENEIQPIKYKAPHGFLIVIEGLFDFYMDQDHLEEALEVLSLVNKNNFAAESYQQLPEFWFRHLDKATRHPNGGKTAGMAILAAMQKAGIWLVSKEKQRYRLLLLNLLIDPPEMKNEEMSLAVSELLRTCDLTKEKKGHNRIDECGVPWNMIESLAHDSHVRALLLIKAGQVLKGEASEAELSSILDIYEIFKPDPKEWKILYLLILQSSDVKLKLRALEILQTKLEKDPQFIEDSEVTATLWICCLRGLKGHSLPQMAKLFGCFASILDHFKDSKFEEERKEVVRLICDEAIQAKDLLGEKFEWLAGYHSLQSYVKRLKWRELKQLADHHLLRFFIQSRDSALMQEACLMLKSMPLNPEYFERLVELARNFRIVKLTDKHFATPHFCDLLETAKTEFLKPHASALLSTLGTHPSQKINGLASEILAYCLQNKFILDPDKSLLDQWFRKCEKRIKGPLEKKRKAFSLWQEIKKIKHWLVENQTDRYRELLQLLINEGGSEFSEEVEIAFKEFLSLPTPKSNKTANALQAVDHLLKSNSMLALTRNIGNAVLEHCYRLANPSQEDLKFLLNYYPQLNPSPEHWVDFFRKISASNNKKIKLQALKILQDCIDSQKLLSEFPRERAQCWVECLRGLKEISCPQFLKLAEKLPFILEQNFLGEEFKSERNELVELIFKGVNRHQRTYKGESEVESFSTYRNKMHTVFISRGWEPLCWTFDWVFLEEFVQCHRPQDLVEACQLLEDYLNQESLAEPIFSHLLALLHHSQKLKLPEEDPQVDKIIDCVRKAIKKDAKAHTLSLVQAMGSHSSPKIAAEAWLLFACGVESEVIDRDVSTLIQISEALFNPSIANHFSQFSSFLLESINSKWLSDLPKKEFFFLTYGFIEKCVETNCFNKWNLNNLQNMHTLAVDCLSSDFLEPTQKQIIVEFCLNVLIALGDKENTIRFDLLQKILDVACPPEGPIKKTEKKKKGRRKKKASSSAETTIPIDARIFELNTYKMKFIHLILSKPFASADQKCAFLKFLYQTVEEIIYSTSKDEQFFLEFLEDYVFVSFSKEQHDLYLKHLAHVKQTIKAAVDKGKLVEQNGELAPMVMHAGIMIKSRIQTQGFHNLVLPLQKMIERLVEHLHPDSIKEASHMVQGGRTLILRMFPHVLGKFYETILGGILRLNSEKDKISCIEYLATGFLESEKNNSLSETQIDEPYKTLAKGGSTLIFGTIFKLLQNSSPDNAERIFSLALNFMTKVLFNHFFDGALSEYLTLMSYLIDELDLLADPNLMIAYGKKIFGILAIVNSKIQLSNEEEGLRAQALNKLIRRLLKTNCYEGFISANELFEQAHTAKKNNFYSKAPNEYEIIREKIKLGFLNLPKASFQKACHSFIRDHRQLIWLFDAEIDTEMTSEILTKLNWIFEAFLAQDHLSSAFRILELSADLKCPSHLESALEEQWIHWMNAILSNSQGGFPSAIEWWKFAKTGNIWKKPYSLSYLSLLKNMCEVIDGGIDGTDRFGGRSFLKQMQEIKSTDYFIREIQPIFYSQLVNQLFKGGVHVAHLMLQSKLSLLLLPAQIHQLTLLIIKVYLQSGNVCAAGKYLLALLNSLDFEEQNEEIEKYFITILQMLLDDLFTLEGLHKRQSAAYQLLIHPYALKVHRNHAGPMKSFIRSFVEINRELGRDNSEEIPLLQRWKDVCDFEKEFQSESPKNLSELSNFCSQPILQANELKAVLSSMISSQKEVPHALATDIVKKILENPEVLVGSKTDLKHCWLYALKVLRKGDREGILYLLKHFQELIHRLNPQANPIFFLRAMREVIQPLSSIFDEKGNFADYREVLRDLCNLLNVYFEALNSIKEESYFKDWVSSSYYRLLIDLKLIIIRQLCQSGEEGELAEGINLLKSISMSYARPRQCRKIFEIFSIILGRFPNPSDEREKILQEVCDISLKLRETCPSNIYPKVAIVEFTRQNHPKLIQEACNLSSRFLKNTGSKPLEECLDEIKSLLSQAINFHFKETHAAVLKCLTTLTQAKFNEGVDVAELWDQFLIQCRESLPYAEVKIETMTQHNVSSLRVCKLRQFELILRSMPGLCRNESLTNFYFDKAITLLQEFFVLDQDVYLLLFRSFWKKVEHVLYLQKNQGSIKNKDLGLIKRAYDFLGTDFIMSSYFGSARDDKKLKACPAIRDKVEELKSNYYCQLLESFVVRYKQDLGKTERADLKKYLKIAFIQVQTELLRLINLPSAENPTIVKLLKAFIFHPLTQCSREIIKKHHEIGKSLLKKAFENGRYQGDPSAYFQLAGMVNLLHVSPLENLSEEEKENNFRCLLNRLSKNDAFYSLTRASELVTVDKPEFLSKNLSFYQECLSIVLNAFKTGLTDNSYVCFLFECFTKHFFEDHQAAQNLGLDTEELETRQKMASEMAEKMFYTMCTMADPVPEYKNTYIRAAVRLLDFFQAGLFSNQYERYQDLVRHLMQLAIRQIETEKQFDLAERIFSLIQANESLFKSNEMKKQRALLLNEWIYHLVQTKNGEAKKIALGALQNGKKKGVYAQEKKLYRAACKMVA